MRLIGGVWRSRAASPAPSKRCPEAVRDRPAGGAGGLLRGGCRAAAGRRCGSRRPKPPRSRPMPARSAALHGRAGIDAGAMRGAGRRSRCVAARRSSGGDGRPGRTDAAALRSCRPCVAVLAEAGFPLTGADLVAPGVPRPGGGPVSWRGPWLELGARTIGQALARFWPRAHVARQICGPCAGRCPKRRRSRGSAECGRRRIDRSAQKLSATLASWSWTIWPSNSSRLAKSSVASRCIQRRRCRRRWMRA